MSNLNVKQQNMVNEAADSLITNMKDRGLLFGDQDDTTIHFLHMLTRNAMHNLVVRAVDPNSKPSDNGGST